MSIVDSRERCLFDVTTPLSGMLFPVLELILWTGLCWIGIGFFDRLPGSLGYEQVGYFPAETRSVLLLVWIILVSVRFVLPLLRARHRRFTVTDQRIVFRSGKLASRPQSIPLRTVYRAYKQRTSVVVDVVGAGQPLVFNKVPKGKQAVSAINTAISTQRRS